MVNEQLTHILYGDGKVISQENDILSIQFAKQYGIKKFVYPDAFGDRLKLHNLDVEMSVLMELRDKQERIEAEELRKQQEFEEANSKVMRKTKTTGSKKKSVI